MLTPTARSIVAVCGCVFVTSACGQMADIELRDGRNVRGEIRGGDRDALYVRVERSGSNVRVPRSEITDIDHPGDTSRWVGIGLVAAGATTAVAGAFAMSHAASENHDSWGLSALPPLLLFALGIDTGTAGLIVTLTSIARGNESREAANGPWHEQREGSGR